VTADTALRGPSSDRACNGTSRGSLFAFARSGAAALGAWLDVTLGFAYREIQSGVSCGVLDGDESCATVDTEH